MMSRRHSMVEEFYPLYDFHRSTTFKRRASTWHEVYRTEDDDVKARERGAWRGRHLRERYVRDGQGQSVEEEGEVCEGHGDGNHAASDQGSGGGGTGTEGEGMSG
ncbi:Hypp3852 [Branchiostoma lanceolatum]|uniref:Hypp3852 protein n=1 Tax=Branchiostoma lanceolatum TaxID=7740 RepID=A0A8K0EVT9_BRALA|nr:Hypp3852 [Branchiostoma lanceolatum]